MDTHKKELIKLVTDLGYRYSKIPFTLSSGQESNHYIDIKNVSLDPLGARLIASNFCIKMKYDRPNFIGGPELGAVPIIGSILALCPSESIPVKAFILRKEPKNHGLGGVIVGNIPHSGSRVTIIEDVLTTGQSAGNAIETIRNTGASIFRVYCVVDREQGGKEYLEKTYGVRVESLCTLSEIINESSI